MGDGVTLAVGIKPARVAAVIVAIQFIIKEIAVALIQHLIVTGRTVLVRLVTTLLEIIGVMTDLDVINLP